MGPVQRGDIVAWIEQDQPRAEGVCEHCGIHSDDCMTDPHTGQKPYCFKCDKEWILIAVESTGGAAVIPGLHRGDPDNKVS